MAQALGYTNHIRTEKATAKQNVIGAILTAKTNRKLEAAAEEGRVQVWTYDATEVLNGNLASQRVA